MKLLEKLKNRRGTTLIEILLVVAIMTTLLGIAAPNLISESQAIKRAAMNDNARAVGVAVQSKLYGVKNLGSDDFSFLNDSAAESIQFFDKTSNEEKTVCLVSNFAYGEADEAAKNRAILGKKYLLSGAITDTELLEKGNIVVGYDSESANVLFVFYCEKPFDVKTLFKPYDAEGNLTLVAYEDILNENFIGYYLGYGVPRPERNVGLPDFTLAWQYDDELYLELQMVGSASPQIADKKLCLEVFACIPKKEGDKYSDDSYDEVLIYTEGRLEGKYVVTNVKNVFDEEKKEVVPIQGDYGTLTVNSIVENGGKLRFALDSLITTRANYGGAQYNLRHQTNPGVVTMASDLLYPRESIANWFNGTVNPYLTFGKRECGGIDGSVLARLFASASVTDFVPVDKSMTLRVKLHVLSDDEPVSAKSEDAPDARLYNFDDETYVPFDEKAQYICPYFYALAGETNTVTLSSIRDLNNLSYVFDTKNDITKATLSGDITEQAAYNKVAAVRQALLKKMPEYKGSWGYAAEWDGIAVSMLYFRNKTEFTLSGEKPDSQGGGSYAIIGVPFEGRAPWPGGLFGFAQNCTFKDLDVINPKVWRNGEQRSFLEHDANSHLVTRLDATYNSVVSGGLVGIAVNCQFTNVRVYIDPDQAFKVENSDDADQKDWIKKNLTDNRISGIVAGGLVGLAIGSDGEKTTFENCAASVSVCTEYYWRSAECVYAGGLVGLTMGKVEINNSYAAGQISGYYAGGLIGGVASPSSVSGEGWNWHFDNAKEPGSLQKINEKGVAKGALTVTNSFAAGIIEYMARVGGGLIAQVDAKDIEKVSNCYSAVQWEILPPVAYGTFEGDTNNYYLYQKELDFPVTANVLARFTCTGDVLSLKNGQDKKDGVACTAKSLANHFGSPDWAGGAASTVRWYWKATQLGNDRTAKYPFPMPKDNDDFWGYWIDSYENELETEPNFSQTFKGYYCGYYEGMGKGGDVARYVDPGVITAHHQIEIKDGNVVINAIWRDDENGIRHTDGTLSADGIFFQEGDAYYYANRVKKYEMYELGTTKITTDGSQITFAAAAYYSSKYDPITGSSFLPTGDGIDYNGIPLGWDFFGFYLLPDYANREGQEMYRVRPKEGVPQGTAIKGPQPKTGVHDYSYIDVNPEEFKAAVGYNEKTLSISNVRLAWDKTNTCFTVMDGQG